MTRQGDCIGSVIDDDIDAGDLLKGADIAPFTADDAPFDFFGRQRHGRDGDFGHIIRSTALDGHADDFTSGFVGFVVGDAFDFTDAPGRFITGFGFDLLQDDFAGLQLGQP